MKEVFKILIPIFFLLALLPLLMYACVIMNLLLILLSLGGIFLCLFLMSYLDEEPRAWSKLLKKIRKREFEDI